MITKASIQNFKGISKCDIEGLDRVNVFIGKNDVCKSSILEAIYYALKEFTSPHLHEVIGRRTNVFFGARELWFNYSMERNISVALMFDDVATATLRIERVPRTPLAFQIKCTGTVEHVMSNSQTKSTIETISIYDIVNWKIEKEEATHRMDFLHKQLSELVGIKAKEYASSCQFLDSSNRNDVSAIENLFGSIKAHGEEREFNRYIRTIFEKGRNVRIKSVPAQQGASDKFRVAMEQSLPPLKRTVFVSGFGDGIRYGMQIVGKSLISRNTGIFVEEIESNQYPASLNNLIDFCVDNSFNNELQLFATTHNPLAFRRFWYHFRPTERKVDPRAHNIKYFHVTRDVQTGEVDCKPVDPHYDMPEIEADLFGI